MRTDVAARTVPATEEIPSAVFTDIHEICMRTQLWYSAVHRHITRRQRPCITLYGHRINM